MVAAFQTDSPKETMLVKLPPEVTRHVEAAALARGVAMTRRKEPQMAAKGKRKQNDKRDPDRCRDPMD